MYSQNLYVMQRISFPAVCSIISPPGLVILDHLSWKSNGSDVWGWVLSGRGLAGCAKRRRRRRLKFSLNRLDGLRDCAAKRGSVLQHGLSQDNENRRELYQCDGFAVL